ncbi:MAG TPA: STAS domain-containing protein [Solirubrobacteraceae bacterium]|nr:STAS domain-containing protein [Solirubrobacteraceae bacterium]
MAGLGDGASLSVSTRVRRDGAAVLTLAGELDSASAAKLGAAARAAVTSGSARVVFELAGLRFMDSAGLAVLITTARDAGHVELRDPSPIVRRLIEATGLTSVFEVLP